jgi:hypothetical protein
MLLVHFVSHFLLNLYNICGILLYTFDHGCGTLFDILSTTLVLHIWKLHYACGSPTTVA